MTNIKTLFDTVYDGRMNPLTPEVLRYGKAGRLCFELSKGEGINGEPLFGVTVLEIDGTKRHDLGQSFPSLSEAEAHISKEIKGS